MKKIKEISEFVSPAEAANNAILRAPNKHKSNLSEKHYAMVRTPEFKAWFGDWENDPENSSKIVDGNGEPMIVYHGTPAYGFEEFINDYKMPRATTNETNNLGMWFTNDKHSAEKFMFKSDKGGVYEVFLNVRNPKIFKPAILNQFEIDKLDANMEEIRKEQARLGWTQSDMTPEERTRYSELKKVEKETWKQWKMMRHNDSFEQFMNYRDKYAEYIDGVKGEVGHWLERMCAMNKMETNKKFLKEIQDDQHDGLAIIDTVYDAPRKNSKISQYCIFDSKAVKSADNNGRFDPNTKNIYESNIYIKTIDSFDI